MPLVVVVLMLTGEGKEGEGGMALPRVVMADTRKGM